MRDAQTRALHWANLPPERKQEIIRRHACHLLAHIEAKRWLADQHSAELSAAELKPRLTPKPTRERPLHPVERFGDLSGIQPNYLPIR